MTGFLGEVRCHVFPPVFGRPQIFATGQVTRIYRRAQRLALRETCGLMYFRRKEYEDAGGGGGGIESIGGSK